jgi:hypothetical protein
MVCVLAPFEPEFYQLKCVLDFAAEDLIGTVVRVEHHAGDMRLALVDWEVRPL